MSIEQLLFGLISIIYESHLSVVCSQSSSFMILNAPAHESLMTLF